MFTCRRAGGNGVVSSPHCPSAGENEHENIQWGPFVLFARNCWKEVYSSRVSSISQGGFGICMHAVTFVI